MASEDKSKDPILKELESIKNLLVLYLFKMGSSGSEIGAALGVGQSSVDRMLPKGVKRYRAK